MLIYTGHSGGKRAEKCKELGLGFMLHSCPSKMPSPNAKGFPCALDNGTVSCWQRGFPFQADVFRTAIKKAYTSGITLDFIVCPDILQAGMKSLEFSLTWLNADLKTAPRVALVVQPGMTPETLDAHPSMILSTYENITHIFIGGMSEWRFQTAPEWIEWAHKAGRKAHIGNCGTVEKLIAAERWGADSVDCTTIARHEYWHRIEQFRNKNQAEMDFESADERGEGEI